MTESAERFHAKVDAERENRKRYFVKLDGEILFSAAFKEITRRGVAVAVLLHVLSRQTFPPRAKDRKRLERAGLWPPKPMPFSLPYREARHHGMTEKSLALGLSVLHEVGFIDRIHSGSGKRGDFAKYIMSDRWRNYGREGFRELPWKKASTVGVRGENGKFVRKRTGKRKAGEIFVAAKSAATKTQRTAKSAATTSFIAAKSAANTPPNCSFVAAKSAVFLSPPSPSALTVADPFFSKVVKDAITPAPIAGDSPWAESEDIVPDFAWESLH